MGFHFKGEFKLSDLLQAVKTKLLYIIHFFQKKNQSNRIFFRLLNISCYIIVKSKSGGVTRSQIRTSKIKTGGAKRLQSRISKIKTRGATRSQSRTSKIETGGGTR